MTDTNIEIGLNNEVIKSIDALQNKFDADLKAKDVAYDTLKSEMTDRIAKLEEDAAKKSYSIGIKKSMFETDLANEFLKTLSKSNKGEDYRKFADTFGKQYDKSALGYQSNVWDSNGVLCPPEYRDTVLDLIYNNPNNTTLLSRINVTSTSNKSIVFPVQTRPMAAVRTEEAEPTIFSKMIFGQKEITARKMSAAFLSTWESEQFSKINVQQKTTAMVARAFQDRIIWELMHGDKNAGLEGILRNSDIEEFPSSVSQAFSISDLFDMFYSMTWGTDPVYIMHKKTFGWIRKQTNNIKDYYNVVDVTAAGIPRINGVPVILVGDLWVDQKLIKNLPYKVSALHNLKSTEAILTSLITSADLTAGDKPFIGGDVPILLSDLRETYTMVNVDDMRAIVDPYSMSITDQTTHIFHMSNGGAVINPKATMKLVIKA